MPDLALEIKNLAKTYKSNGQEVSALSDLSLNIKKGSIFGLLGPNGAGKSTLINILAGLVNKSSGTVKVLGHDIDKEYRKAKYKLGIVPQELVLDPFFSVKETLDIYAGYYGIKSNKLRTEEIINALGLKDKTNSNPRALSGGMKRRLLVAKALVHSPDILILDEPTAGVDIELRRQLWDYVVTLNKAGTTIILTTHYLEEAEELCDEIAIINKGKLIANDKTKNLKKIFGKKKIIVELKESEEKLEEDLKKDGFNINEHKQIIVESEAGETKLSKLLQILAQKQIPLQEIKSEESDLEDIFRILINGKSDS